FATFSYSLNFNAPAGGTLSVSRGSETLTSGSIVHALEVLGVTYDGPGRLVFTGLEAAAPGTTIDPFTGAIKESAPTNENPNNTGETTEIADDGGSSGGCSAGMAGFALLAFAMIAASAARKKAR
ncbi:MAG: hypothetical protein LBG29_00875, partial [Synergistaceae bacterium]|nr:hypothetical protein [Synergistaceae bacterium]